MKKHLRSFPFSGPDCGRTGQREVFFHFMQYRRSFHCAVLPYASRLRPVSESNRWAVLPLKVNETGEPME